jgi:hypothetical protein
MNLTLGFMNSHADNSITIIIAVWKGEYLDQQLKSLVEQSVMPTCIWVLQHGHDLDVRAVVGCYSVEFPFIYVIHSGFNLARFGRFSLCSHVETEYILVIDDDVVPSRSWLEICLEKCRKYNAVISCTGRIVRPQHFRPGEHGDDTQAKYEYNYQPEDRQVDYGCKSYFIRAEWMRYFWSVWPITLLSGEDIHLSASLSVSKSIRTFVPQQLSEYTSGNLLGNYCQNELLPCRRTDLQGMRQIVFDFFIKEKKWRLLSTL